MQQSDPRLIAVLVAIMVVLIVGVDVLLLRHHVWARLLVNVGIVLIFGGLYLRFFRAP